MLAADRALDEAGVAAQPQHLALDRPHRARGRARASRASRRGRRRRRRPRPPPTTPSSVITPVTRSPSTRRPVTRARRGSTSNARASAATSLRGSIEWSPSMSSASRIVGASAGSSRRACDGRSRSTGSPSPRRNSARRSSASASSRSRATTSVPTVAVAGVLERGAEVRVAARALQPQFAAARARRTRPRTSGASMPAATCHAAGSPASSTTTRAPRCAARHAHARPIAPPPTTATSKLSDCAATALLASLRRYYPDQVRRSAPRWRPLSPIAGSRVLPSWYPLMA